MEKIAQKAEKFFKEINCWHDALNIIEKDGHLIVQDNYNENKPYVIGQIVYVGGMSEALADLSDDIPKKELFAVQKSLKGGEWRTNPTVLRMLCVEKTSSGEKERLKAFSAVRCIALDDTFIISPELCSYHEGETVRSSEFWTKKALIEAIQSYDATVIDFI